MSKDLKHEIEAANNEAAQKMLEAQPVLVGIKPAGEVIPSMKRNKFLHAAPPNRLDRVCGPHVGSMIAKILFEGLAETPEQAKRMIDNEEVEIEPAHNFNAVAGGGRMISVSSPLFVLHDKIHGNFAYSALKEDAGFRSSGDGVYEDEVIRKLHQLKNVIAPALNAGLEESEGIDMRTLISRAIMMGDDCHNRGQAGILLFEKAIIHLLLKANVGRETMGDVVHLLDNDEGGVFFVLLAMGAAKLMTMAADGVKNSTVVTTMARNGVDFGIRVSGLGDQWFTAPAPRVKGLYFPGYSADDACPDLGDSSITETAGFGCFAMAAAPALTQFVGGTVQDAINFTKQMCNITVAKNNAFPIPYLDFMGTPTGIDVIKVVETGIEPVMNTSINHRKAGFGQIGAGLVRAPMECFNKALRAIGEKTGV